jgi:hypothetical protein
MELKLRFEKVNIFGVGEEIVGFYAKGILPPLERNSYNLLRGYNFIFIGILGISGTNVTFFYREATVGHKKHSRFLFKYFYSEDGKKHKKKPTGIKHKTRIETTVEPFKQVHFEKVFTYDLEDRTNTLYTYNKNKKIYPSGYSTTGGRGYRIIGLLRYLVCNNLINLETST